MANPVAVGIFGYSYLEENLDKIEGVKMAGVAPVYAAIADGSYPASRPLYIYVKGEHLRAKPALAAFLSEYASDDRVGTARLFEGRAVSSPRPTTSAPRTPPRRRA